MVVSIDARAGRSSCPNRRGAIARATGLSTECLPQVDLSPCLLRKSDNKRSQVAKDILHALREYSCVVVRDPRVPASQNDVFLDTMEDYFSQPREVKMLDARPDLSYQVRCDMQWPCMNELQSLQVAKG